MAHLVRGVLAVGSDPPVVAQQPRPSPSAVGVVEQTQRHVRVADVDDEQRAHAGRPGNRDVAGQDALEPRFAVSSATLRQHPPRVRRPRARRREPAHAHPAPGMRKRASTRQHAREVVAAQPSIPRSSPSRGARANAARSISRAAAAQRLVARARNSSGNSPRSTLTLTPIPEHEECHALAAASSSRIPRALRPVDQHVVGPLDLDGIRIADGCATASATATAAASDRRRAIWQAELRGAAPARCRGSGRAGEKKLRP